MIRTRLLPVALLALALACGGDLPAAFLHIEAQPGTPAPDTLELRFLAPDGADLFHYESIPLGGLDLTVERYTVRVEAGGDSPFAKPVQVAVTGLAAEVPVASWTGTIDLARHAEQTLVLAPLQAGCDRDGDGFKDCSTSGCCAESEAPFADCDDDSALEQPLAADARCRACADSDGDAVSDCRELTHEPPCDPDEAASAPDAPEVCDSRDNDCDGQTDEGQLLRDWDGLVRSLGEGCGTGACAGGTVGCLEGEAACSTASLRSTEVTADLLDNDCNGATDEGGALDDTDGDGVPDADEVSACAVPHAELRAEVHPGAAEACCPAAVGRAGGAVAVCDLDCDGAITACGADDTDGDGFGAPIECDDGDAAVYPGAPEKCGDGVDQDCDGHDTPCTAALDEDGDGYLKAVDCDDDDVAAHPGAAERCNGLDDDCDGLADEGNPEATDPGGAPTPCGLAEGECVEGLSACHHAPGSSPLVLCLGNTPPTTETCNDRDDDCDGVTDAGLDPLDAGCLTAGVCAGHEVAACVQGVWTCPYAAAIGAEYENPETTCDGKDNDCDGATDEDLGGPALSTCRKAGECQVHLDEIVAICEEGVWSCAYPFASYQEVEDRCDGLDNDCDGATDEGLALVDWDDAIVPLGEPCGTGLCADGVVTCDEAGGATCSTGGSSQPEACNGADDDCDGDTDEDFAWGVHPLAEACDGTGACGLGLVECKADGQDATCSTNADGSDPDVADEACNLADDDCDGLTDEELDAKATDAPCLRQGVCTVFNVVATCDDGTWACDYSMIATYEPGAETLCDDKDNDCDGEVDEDLRYLDPLGTRLWLGSACDGVGECGGGTVQCGLGKAITCSTNPDGDSPEAVPETCNGLDDNCDGDSDEPYAWNGLPIGAACNGVGECASGLVECGSATAATCSSNPDGSAPGAALEVCDLLDDDCDGLTDEQLDAAAADASCRFLGVCTRLNVVATCVDGDWECDYGNLPAYDDGVETHCDGLDNDCDGQTDEDFSWTDPVSGLSSKKGAPCGSGACLGGVVVCTSTGDGLACSTDLAVDFEVCDDLDNDCDGQTDEGLRYTDPSSGAPLSLGEACDGVGACGAGVVQCSVDKAITCSTNADGSTPEDELDACDGLDNDCDGLSDEELSWQGLALGEACDGTGECGVGVVVCAVNAAVTTCSTNSDGPDAADGPEACNGLDDDCDGADDDGLTVDDSPCLTTGACVHALVAATCSGAGAWLCDYSAVPGWKGGDEVGKCDSVDNDCDGLTDEDFATLALPCDGDDDDACAYGLGVCTADGGGVRCDDQSPAVEACGGDDPSTGLGVDEDCDGLTDEPGAQGCEPHFLDLDGDGFGRTGESRCQCGPDAVSHYTATVDADCDDSAEGGALHPGAAEMCNGLDDDCDGLTDASDPDLAAQDAPTCLLQAGVCAGSTRPPALCQGGAWTACTEATYLATAATYEHGLESSCDGLDNDCDGLTDDDFALTLPDGAVATRVGDACGVGACAGGTIACNAVADGLICPSVEAASPERCGGGDDDCDGLVDALDLDLSGNDHPPCEIQLGVCRDATKPAVLCEAGTWKACDAGAYAAHAATFQATTETSCDGLDNDCNGSTDEDFSLVLPNGATITTVGVACGVGACAGGTSACRADATGLACTSLVNLEPEVCGGGDDDCDGLTDANDPDLPTNDAPACEKTMGVCAGTIKPPAFCTQGAWTTCPAAFYLEHDARYEATELTCEGVDNDCDGAIDDDFQVTTPDGSTYAGVGKPCGTGACAGGVTLCTADHAGVTCSSLAESSPETCDTHDEDCDGLTDAADPNLQRPLCSNQHGVCSGSLPAPARCSGGSWTACSIVDYTAHSLAYTSDAETAAAACDGFDNNCNNETDEGYVSTPTACGKGACARTGALICTSGAIINTCVAGTPAADDTTCDKIDDDCDDSTDEEFPAGPSTCGVGACARTGTRSCTNGVPSDTCAPGAATDERCNGADDDCDGLTDAADTGDVEDGYLLHDHPTCAQQDGVCAGAEKTAALCYGGAWHECDAAALLVHTATYEAGAEATCDGLDNDCDANVDEDFSLLMPDGTRVDGVGEDCGVGACADGTTLCNDARDGLECTALANLGDEVCGGGDEDCDGRTDEYLGSWSTVDAVATKAGGVLSAAVASNGTLYVAFQYDPASAKDLYLAENPGTGWTATPIVTEHAVGGVSALVLDGTGNLHLVYNDDEASTKELRIVSRLGGVWGAPVTVDGRPSAKITVANVSADVDATDALHVAYYVSDGDKKDLRYATDYSGAWVVEEVEPGNSLDVGRYASLRVASTGWPHIGYADLTSALVKYASRNGGGWTVETVTGVSSSTSYSVSLALDADDVPYLGFYDGFNSAVRVATRADAGWTSRVVESSVSVGTYGTSISVDEGGGLHVAYHVISALNDLHYASAPSFAGAWSPVVLDEAGATGRNPALLRTPEGRLHVVHQTSTGQLRHSKRACP